MVALVKRRKAAQTRHEGPSACDRAAVEPTPDDRGETSHDEAVDQYDRRYLRKPCPGSDPSATQGQQPVSDGLQQHIANSERKQRQRDACGACACICCCERGAFQQQQTAKSQSSMKTEE